VARIESTKADDTDEIDGRSVHGGEPRVRRVATITDDRYLLVHDIAEPN
jgi:hypothetical protein